MEHGSGSWLTTVGRGRRIAVRRFRAADLPAFLRYHDDPAVRRYQRGLALDTAGASAFVLQQAAMELERRGAWHAFAVEHHEDGVLVGDVGIWIPTEVEPGTGDVGFQLDPRHHHRGFAGEALEVFLPFAFSAFGLAEATASCDARNTASSALLERSGFELRCEMDGERRYRLTRERWNERAESRVDGPRHVGRDGSDE